MIFLCKTHETLFVGSKLRVERIVCDKCGKMLKSKSYSGGDIRTSWGTHFTLCPHVKESYFYKLGFERGQSLASGIQLPSPEEIEEIKVDIALNGDSCDDDDTVTEILCKAILIGESNDRQYSPFEMIASYINSMLDPVDCWSDFDKGIQDGVTDTIDRLYSTALR